jgi:putative redox protein
LAGDRVQNPAIGIAENAFAKHNVDGSLEMQAKIKWLDNVAFVGESESGHAFVMDGAPEGGGRNLGPRPMEVVLIGTGACSAYDVVTILKQARQQVRDCTVEIDAERAPTEPKVFTRIHMHFVVTGVNVKPAQVKRAVELSAEKYCSASIMLGKSAQITHDFEIIDDEAAVRAEN